MVDSSRSVQKAVMQFLLGEGGHASQIYRRLEEVYGEHSLARCTTFRWCQRYETGRVNIKDLPRPGQVLVVTTVARFWLWMSSCSRNFGSPHVKLLLNSR
ncbi:hypothetical protein AVEN_84606-1 [Araneus ventricosus]|uniref:Mos1 transposase HTH domain-containing protein n=1 Tax=Araneus ventricosus TaxID=182803 RepID=A0A4Y2C0V9_ARAVE|nr:hypothetical protein AVEN_84606-1 [Araneus ventricosus]